MITDFILRPAAGSFDAGAVQSHLETTLHAARDPIQGVMYMVATSEQELQEALEERRDDPKKFPITVILIGVAPHQILVAYRTPEIEPARAFVQWLRSQYDLRILDEELHDITAQCDDHLSFLFGP